MKYNKDLQKEWLMSILDSVMPDSEAEYKWRLADELLNEGVVVIPIQIGDRFTRSDRGLHEEYVVDSMRFDVHATNTNGKNSLIIADALSRRKDEYPWLLKQKTELPKEKLTEMEQNQNELNISAPESESRSAWNSVEDRLPEKNVFVLAAKSDDVI